MKKKNVIGHMTVPKEKGNNWFCRHHIFQKFLCLLLAVLIWLIVVDLTPEEKEEPPALPPDSDIHLQSEES